MSADFGAAVGPLRPRLFARAMAMVRHRAAADDLVQEALLRALEAWPRFQPDASLEDAGVSSWLHRIMANLLISEHRKSAHAAAKMAEAGSEAGRLTMGSRGEPAAGYLMGRGLERALDQLDPDQRDVIVRYDLGGDTYPEIARALGVRTGTIHSRLHRARRRLAELLGEG